MPITYLDFEYKYDEILGRFNIICLVAERNSSVFETFDTEEMKTYFLDKQDDLFISWNVSGAEAKVMCQLMGRDFVLGTNWVDLWTEFKMLCLTHPKYFSQKTGLLAGIETLGLKDEYKADKGETLKIILENDTYTEEQKKSIIFYCKEDVLVLSKIAKKLGEKFKKYDVKLEERISRGNH